MLTRFIPTTFTNSMSEYWLQGDTLSECGNFSETNHEGYVVQTLAENLGLTVIDEWEALTDEQKAEALEKSELGSPEALLDARKVLDLDRDTDARCFAVRFWDWVHLSFDDDVCFVGCRQWDAKTKKRVGDAIFEHSEEWYNDSAGKDVAVTVYPSKSFTVPLDEFLGVK